MPVQRRPGRRVRRLYGGGSNVMTGGVGPRRKGYRIEAKVRAMAITNGVECRRVPLSGAAPGWGGDLIIGSRTFEVKARAAGFRRLYGWLGPHFGLIVAADREEPLVVLRLGDFLRQCSFRDRVLGPRPKGPAGTSGRPEAGEPR